MKVRSFGATRVTALGLAAAVLLGTSALAAGPAGASHKKAKPKPKPKVTTTLTAKELKTLATKVKSGKGASYQAVYTASLSGKTETITFAQTPPKFLFKTTSGSVIDTGTETVFCSASTCFSTGTSDPLASLLDLFSATAAYSRLTAAEAAVAAKAHGYTITFSSGTFGGVASKCATVSGPTGKGKYCVSGSGFLTYVGAAGATVQLTSFTKGAPSSDFTLPSGATVQTLPPGVTIP
jgi:hypothetical protein